MFDLVPNTSLAIINRCVLLITWWVVLLKLYLVSVKQLISWVLLANFSHCVKMSVFGVFLVRISAFGPTAWKVSKYGVFSGLHFPAFGGRKNRGQKKLRICTLFTQWLNTETKYSVFFTQWLNIQPSYRKIQTRKTPNTGTFQTVFIMREDFTRSFHFESHWWAWLSFGTKPLWENSGTLGS